MPGLGCLEGQCCERKILRVLGTNVTFDLSCECHFPYILKSGQDKLWINVIYPIIHIYGPDCHHTSHKYLRSNMLTLPWSYSKFCQKIYTENGLCITVARAKLLHFVMTVMGQCTLMWGCEYIMAPATDTAIVNSMNPTRQQLFH
jgi:hypothetical protein